MHNIYVSSIYKRTLWFKNKVWNKNIKLSTKTTKLIKKYTDLQKVLRTSRFSKKKHKLSFADMLRHDEIKKLIIKFFSLKTKYAAKCLNKNLN